MGWVGSANNMKWVGLGVNLMGWVDKNGPMSMSATLSAAQCSRDAGARPCHQLARLLQLCDGWSIVDTAASPAVGS